MIVCVPVQLAGRRNALEWRWEHVDRVSRTGWVLCITLLSLFEYVRGLPLTFLVGLTLYHSTLLEGLTALQKRVYSLQSFYLYSCLREMWSVKPLADEK